MLPATGDSSIGNRRLYAKLVLHRLQTSEILSLPETHSDLSLSLPENDSVHPEMNHTPRPRHTEDHALLSMPESFARHQRLRAIAAGGENLYEPPNTAEAFARLEAAIDEVKFQGSMSEGKGLTIRRPRLRAIVATCQDLYEPPDTVEAFARLEAAIDEVKRHALASDKDDGQDHMLDPPNTAERFNRIESAIDEVLAGRNITTGPLRQAKRSEPDPHLSTPTVDPHHKEVAHLLRKRQLRFADQSTPAESNHLIENETREHIPSASACQCFCKHGPLQPRGEIHRSSNEFNQTPCVVDMTRHSLVELPISEAEGAERYDEVDVFQDDVAVQAFANRTYQSAREKYS